MRGMVTIVRRAAQGGGCHDDTRGDNDSSIAVWLSPSPVLPSQPIPSSDVHLTVFHPSAAVDQLSDQSLATFSFDLRSHPRCVPDSRGPSRSNELTRVPQIPPRPPDASRVSQPPLRRTRRRPSPRALHVASAGRSNPRPRDALQALLLRRDIFPAVPIRASSSIEPQPLTGAPQDQLQRGRGQQCALPSSHTFAKTEGLLKISLCSENPLRTACRGEHVEPGPVDLSGSHDQRRTWRRVGLSPG